MQSDILDLVVLNYNDSDTVIEYIKRIMEYKIFDHIVIVDNCSTDNSIDKIENVTKGKIEVIKTKKNGGYGYGNNYGVMYCYQKYNPKFVLITNPDVEYKESTVENMIHVLEKYKDAAVVAPIMKDGKGNIEERCAWKIRSAIIMACSTISCVERRLNLIHYKGFPNKIDINEMPVGAVAGSMLMVRTKDMVKYGMYDEKMFLYCEESLLGIKMKKANKKTYILLNDYFIHKHGVSIRKTIKSDLEKYRMITRNRLYLTENYLTQNKLVVFFCKILLWISEKENERYLKRIEN